MLLIYLTTKMKIMSEYIPVHQYAKEKGITTQTAYRWIREGKLPKESVKKEQVTVERIRVKKEE